MKNEVLLVLERAIFCVVVSRVLAVEWDSDVRNPDLLQRRIREGEADFGPFTDSCGTGHLRPLAVSLVGTTNEPADIPLAAEGSEVGK